MKTNVIWISLLVGGCGGGSSPLDPGAGSDPGGGTSTLLVDGTASAEPRLDNADVSTDFDTTFSVRVTLNGQAVTEGAVTISSASTAVDLIFDPVNEGGRWRGTAAGYDEVYALDVASGDDSIEGVRVDGPDIHTFVTPAMGATVDSTQPLEVDWTRIDAAETASIDADKIDTLAITDSGAFSLPAHALKSDRDRPRENVLRVTRVNRIEPAGAVAGSQWRVTIRNQIQVLAAADPSQ
jgi:hypothetical protein